jgi:hypothetical protein
LYPAARGLCKIGELFGLRRAEDERPILGANGVVRRNDAGLGVTREIRAIDEIKDRRVTTEIEDEPAPCAFDALVIETAGSTPGAAAP